MIATTILPAAPLGSCPFSIRSDAQTKFGAATKAVWAWINAQVGLPADASPRSIY